MKKKDYETKNLKEAKNNGMKCMKEKEQSPLEHVNKRGRVNILKKRYS